MKPKVLGLYGSPRKGGNTALLLDEFIKGAESAGAASEKVLLAYSNITPCLEYMVCAKKGECSIQDGMTPLYQKLMEADLIALASPIFFYGVTAQTKALIDRCQAFWARKYLLKNKFTGSRVHKSTSKRKGFFISVAATKGEKVFDGALLTVRYFFDVLNCEYAGNLLFREIDIKGAIKKHPTALREAYDAGKKLVTADLADYTD